MRDLDREDRDLTAAERDARTRCLPGLQGWQTYLNGRKAWGRLDDAIEQLAPCGTRYRRSHLHDVAGKPAPVVVAPTMALKWLQLYGHGGRAGTGVPLTTGLLIDALDFIGAVPRETFRPLDDDRGQRRLRGWWALAEEHRDRLTRGVFVPVLTPFKGRTKHTHQPVTPRRIPRPVAVADAGGIGTLLRDLVTRVEPTIRLATAVAEGRPLATRRSGHPTTRRSAGPPVNRAQLLVSLHALALYIDRHGGRVGVAPMAAATLDRSLSAYAQANPAALARAEEFSTLDAGRRRKQRDWWRVYLGGLGLGELDSLRLSDEWDALAAGWRRAREPEAVPVTVTGAAALPVTAGGYVPIPPNFDPTSMSDDELAMSVDIYGPPVLSLLPERYR